MGAPAALRRGDGVAIVLAVPLGVWLGHLHRGSFIAINAANIGRALPSLAVIAIGLSVVFGFGFTNVLGRARHPRRAADPHQRLRRGGRGRAGRGRGRARDGDDGLRRRCGGSSCRSRSRSSSPASAPPPCSSSRAPRSRRSPAAAGSARSSSTRRATGRRVWSGRRSSSRCSRFAADFALGLLQRALTPRGLRTRVPAFEPDVVVTQTGGNEGVIRKHNRRAAKAAFAVAIGVALVLGRSHGRARGARPRARRPGHRRGEELHRAVRARPALQAGARGQGLKVSYKENIGSTEIAAKALTSGQITLYPEYTGVMLSVILRAEDDAEDGSRDLHAREGRSGGARLRARAADAVPGRDAIAVLRTTATRYGLKTIGDLRKVPTSRSAAFPEFETRHIAPTAAGRDGEGVRGQERRVQAARRDQRLHAARPRRGGGGRHLHHRPAADLDEVRGLQDRATCSASSTWRRSSRRSSSPRTGRAAER